ncbi:MAG: hypothetical protein FWC70_08995 [Defluviitaleaceae bacterium]|nr:hypothetical protein [Defluviitaleaceae bacterium]
MTQRDYRLLTKIAAKQASLSSMVKEFKIVKHEDMRRLHPAVRRGIVGFIADIFELTKPLSDSAQKQMPFNHDIMKRFRNSSTHNYDVITDNMAHMCLKHCVDSAVVSAIQSLIDNYSNEKIVVSERPQEQSAASNARTLVSPPAKRNLRQQNYEDEIESSSAS